MVSMRSLREGRLPAADRTRTRGFLNRWLSPLDPDPFASATEDASGATVLPLDLSMVGGRPPGMPIFKPASLPFNVAILAPGMAAANDGH